MDDLENSATSQATTLVESEQAAPSSTDNPIEPERPPLKAWLTVFGAFLSIFCASGQMSSFGIFQSWYARNQLSGYPPSTLSLIGSFQLWIFFFSGGLIGWLFDRHGPRMLMAVGTVVFSLSIMLISICRHYYQYFLCQGMLFGIGVGLLYYPSVAAVSTQFSQYRATALGVAVSGACAGGVVFPIVLEKLFTQVGFASGVRITGFICLGCTLFGTFTVTARKSPLPRDIRNCASEKKQHVNAFKDFQFMILSVAGFFASLGMFVPTFYIVEFAQGASAHNNANYILSIMNAGGFVGRIVPSYFSDRFGRFNLTIPCMFFSGLSCIILWLPASLSSARAKQQVLQIVFSVTFGFFQGGFISLINACITQISDISEIGSRMGLFYCLASFPALGGGPIAGVLQKSGNTSDPYLGTILFAGFTLIIGSVFILWIRLRIDPHLVRCI